MVSQREAEALLAVRKQDLATQEIWGAWIQPDPDAKGDFFTLVAQQAETFKQNKCTTFEQWPSKEKLLGPLITLEKWGLGVTSPLLAWVDGYLAATGHPLAPEVEGGKSELTCYLAAQVEAATTGSQIEWISGVLLSKLSGILNYNPLSGALEITSKGRQLGHTTASIYPCMRLEICEQLGIREKLLPQNFFRELVMKVARDSLSLETPIQELQRKLNSLQAQLPALEGLRAAQPPQTITQATGGPWKAILERVEPLFAAYNLSDNTDREHFFRFLVGLAARTHSPGCPLHWALTLSGNGGCGKTSFGEILALDSAPAVSVAMGQLGTKGLIESISSSSLLILDELDNYTRKRDLAELKDFITASTHNVRKAYRADSEGIPAAWAFLATTNADSLPCDDGAQMRRWAWVGLTGGVEEGEQRVQFLKENKNLLHALGYLAYLGGYSYKKFIPADETPKEILAIDTPDEATLVAHFSKQIENLICVESGKLIAMNTEDIWNLVSNKEYHPRKAPPIIAALESQGWTKTAGKRRKVYWAPASLQGQEITEETLVYLLPKQKLDLKDSLSRQNPGGIG
jgi:hypothetical protein